MKFHTTRKEITANYPHVIKVGYCTLQTLLTFRNPIAYTARREGWAADIYEINPTTVIVSGYAPFGNIQPDYNTLRRYELAAENARYNMGLSYEDQKTELNKLLAAFVGEVIR